MKPESPQHFDVWGVLQATFPRIPRYSKGRAGLKASTRGSIFMTKIRRGNYIFVTFRGDHDPPHVHIFRDGIFVAKFDLERWEVMEGAISRRLCRILENLRDEGKL